MKKINCISGIALGLASILLPSCSESFLTEEPSSKLPLDTYYNSYSRCEEAAVAAYHPLQWFDYFAGWAPLNLVWDCQGDDIYIGGANTSDQGQLHLISQYLSDPNNTIGGAWTTAYSGINRSIRLIDDAVACDALTEKDRNAFVAEGHVLRNWYYLTLWKIWGNIPYYEENLTFPYIAEQLKADQVYENCVKDLEATIDMNALPNKRPDEWAGRMTQAIAKMIYADFVMIQADQSRYPKALAYMKDIIASGDYGLVPGADYDHLFDLEHEWNKEIIFDINFQAKGGKRDWGNANATGGTVLPVLIGIDGLSYKDVTDPALLQFNTGGWGFGVVSKEVYDACESGDLRRDVAILNADKYMEENFNSGAAIINYGGRYQNTGYFLRKYQGRPGCSDGATAASNLNADNNLHLYRYAETLLNAAELGMYLGDSQAQSYLDQVRSRAGLAPKPLSIDNILAERRIEFVGEGKRYFDLVRTGKALTVLSAGAGCVMESHRKLVQDGNGWKWEGQNKWSATGKAIPERKGWTEKKRWIPIPQGEIESCNGFLEGSLIQNEY